MRSDDNKRYGIIVRNLTISEERSESYKYKDAKNRQKD